MANAGSKITRLSWLAAAGLVAWAAARITAADREQRTETLVVPLLSFTPLVALAAPGTVLALRLAGRRGPAATAAVAATALGLVVGSRGFPRPQPPAGGPVLRVLSLNMYLGQADAELVVDRVRQAGADVLFLQELTEAAVRRLEQAGLNDLLPHSRTELGGGGSRGSGIYARFPLGKGAFVAPVPRAQPTALLELPGGQAVELICAHPSPPIRARSGGAVRWRAELAVLPPPGTLPRVMAGDFNATLDHAAFRALLGGGYRDAAVQAGRALTPTWGPPGKNALLTIDHVLVDRGCAVLAYSVHVVPGSDHRAVYAEIQLP